MPPCAKTNSRAPKAVPPEGVSSSDYPSAPSVDLSSHLSTTSPSSFTCSRMEFYSVVSGMLTTGLTTSAFAVFVTLLFLHSPQCTVTCGGGVQSRTVQCLVQGKPSPDCAVHLKPLMSQACNTNFCPQPDKKGTLRKLSQMEASFNQSEQS